MTVILNTKMYTVKELAEELDVTRRTLYRWRKRGAGPPAMRLGGRWYYSEKGLRKWLNPKHKEK